VWPIAGLFAAMSFSVAPAAADPWKWGPSVDFEVKPGTERSLGEVDLFAPLAQSDDTLLFGNMRARLDDNDSVEGNFGIGVRHMLASGWNIGAFGYYDRRRTDFDNIFNQVTIGFEALGRDFDFRANAYLPVGDTMKGEVVSGGGLSVANLVGSTVQVTTSGGTLTGEQALHGFDAEIGWRVPLWQEKLDKVMRLYAGMFHFDGDGVEDVTGPRLRAELTMYEVPGLWEGARLTFGAEYQWDDVRGSQAFALARLRIPLQKDAGANNQSMQELRMTERVVRDVDVVTDQRSEELAAIVETATETADGDALAVVTSDSGNGTLTDELSAAGINSTVVASGTFNMTSSSDVQDGQTLLGAGSVDVRTATGRTATLTTPGATISVENDAILDLGAGSVVSGLTLNLAISTPGSFAGVGLHNPGATLIGNTISVTSTSGVGGSTGVAISGDNSRVEDNVITVTSIGSGGGDVATAIGVALNTAGVTVRGNTLNASGAATNEAVWADGGSSFAAGSTDNILISGGCTDLGIASGSVEFTNGTSCP
jgi:hypothetical protein